MVYVYKYKSTRDEYLNYVLEIVGLYRTAVQRYVEVPPDIKVQQSGGMGDKGLKYAWESNDKVERVAQRLNALGYRSFSPTELSRSIDALGLEFLKFSTTESDRSLYYRSEAALEFRRQIFQGLNDKEFFILADVFVHMFSTFSYFRVFTGLESFHLPFFDRSPNLYPDLYRDARLRFFDFNLEFGERAERFYRVRQVNSEISSLFPDVVFRFTPIKYEQFEHSMTVVLESSEEGDKRVFSRKGKYKWVFYFLESLFGPLTEMQIRRFLYQWCCFFEGDVRCNSAKDKAREVFMGEGERLYITWDDNLIFESIEEDPNTFGYYFSELGLIPDGCKGMTRKEQNEFVREEILDHQDGLLEDFWIYKDLNIKEKVLNSIGHKAYVEYRRDGGFNYNRDRFSD